MSRGSISAVTLLDPPTPVPQGAGVFYCLPFLSGRAGKSVMPSHAGVAQLRHRDSEA